MTKIHIISGFLGAGKTTLIKKLLEEALAGQKVVLIENEFGEIGIDGGFLKDSGIQVREMNSGCICCSLVGDFGKSLEEVLAKYKPDRVIIEPSGVGKLSDVAKAVGGVEEKGEARLNGMVTMVDALKCRMYMKNFGEFFENQVEHADLIILSRTDVADPKKVEEAVGIIRGHNKKALVVTTPCSQLDGRKLLDLMERPKALEEKLLEEAKNLGKGHGQPKQGGCCGKGEDKRGGCCGKGDEIESGCCGHGHEAGDHHHGGKHQHVHEEDCQCGCHGHHAEEVFASWGLETTQAYAREELDAILDELAYGNQYGDVLRAKGMLPSQEPGQWHYFDMVPEQYEIRPGNPDYTGKVCVIGVNLNQEALNGAFKKKA